MNEHGISFCFKEQVGEAANLQDVEYIIDRLSCKYLQQNTTMLYQLPTAMQYFHKDLSPDCWYPPFENRQDKVSFVRWPCACPLFFDLKFVASIPTKFRLHLAAARHGGALTAQQGPITPMTGLGLRMESVCIVR